MRNIFLNVNVLFFLFHTVAGAAHFATAGYGNHTPDEWYTVETHSFPEVDLLSQDRNLGVSSGRVYLSPTGLTIGEAGNYEVSITAILLNPGEEDLLIPVYLSIDDAFDPSNSNPVGGVGIVTPGRLQTIHGDGYLVNVQEGARLSLVVTNGGYPLPQSVQVAGWAISAKRID